MRTILIKILFLLLLMRLGVLTYAQDKKTLPVYEEFENSDEYLWSPAGWMPDSVGISFQDDFEQNCHSGKTCIKIGYNCKKKKWVGIYWLAYGRWSGPGIDLYTELNVDEKTPVVLAFWARGEHGEENVQFKGGGLKEGKGSIDSTGETDWIKLTKDWKQYKIDLTGKDLSNVVGGFCWVTERAKNPGRKEIWLYLDDIRFETE